ncbi:ATPase [Clostridia bacterium]|nr:ATPase [Clostridia bacterium]
MSAMTHDSCIHAMRNVVRSIEKVIIGKQEAVEFILCALLCEGHVLIEDVPGVGKTSLVHALARSVGCTFRRIQFTPDILPSDITGFSVFSQKTGEFEYKKGAAFTNVLLADEINRASPKTQSSLLEAMEERQVTVDGQTYALPRPFIVLATQNPIEHLGTYPLPEAQLDRFFMKISIGYPALRDEVKILERFKAGTPLENLSPVISDLDVMELRERAETVYVNPIITDYIVKIVTDTRQNPLVTLGASPRASLCLYRAARAWAFYSGRDFATPDDVKKMAVPVLSHRILLKHEAKVKKILPENIIEQALDNVPAPL